MQIRTASVISTALHIAVLGWATLSFSGKTFEVTPPESLPVDIITDKDFSEITKGVKDAKKVEEKPKPVVEKIAEPPPKPVEELKPTINEKREVAINKDAAPEPPKPEKPPEKKPEAKPEPPKPDAIADKLKDEKPKQEAKAEPLPPKKPPMPKPQPQQKFDADKIAALLDKRDPTRAAATGAEMNQQPSLGRSSGAAAQLSMSELDALRRRIQSCWNVPAGAENVDTLRVYFRVNLRRDGSIGVAPEPVEIQGQSSPFTTAFIESGRRAILQCQPYTMLRPEKYDTWKEMEIGFRPTDMFQ
jgi:colicin import membrane protein